MRILILSDSHGRPSRLEEAIEAQPLARHVFFLGDGARDIERVMELYPDRSYHIVSGNCDFSGFYPAEKVCDIDGTRIFFCHGHTLGVKSSREHILKKAESLSAQIALYGHTHTPLTEYRDGIYLVCPGSVSRGRDGGMTYAVVDIEKNGMLPIIVNL